MIEKYIQALREYALSHDPSCADEESVLGMLTSVITRIAPMTTMKSKRILINSTSK